MRYAISLLAAAALMASGAASAQVFKCKGAGGKTVYSDAPCQDGTPGSVVNTSGNVAESDSTRAAARGDFDDPVQRTVQPQRGNYAPAPTQQAKPIDQIACKNANRDLDLAKSKMSLEISRGKPPGPMLSAVKSAEIGVDAACGTSVATTRARTESMRTTQPAQAGVAAQPANPAPSVMTHCAGGFCHDNLGTPYSRSADGRFMHNSGTGQTCSVAANGRSMICN